MKNNKKIKSVMIGTILTFALLLIEVVMVLFKDNVSYNSVFGKSLFILIILSTIMSVVYNMFSVLKNKSKEDKYYHIGLVLVSIILCVLGIYKCM